jgi:hypothetical protein
MVTRIDILVAKVEIQVMPAAVCGVLRSGSFDPSVTPASPKHTDHQTLSVAAAFTRVGKDVRMVIAGPDTGTCKPSPDATLIKLIGKAHRLNERLTAGEMNISDIAASEGVHRSYIGRTIRLAYLAPEITEAILDGRQPPGLNGTRLLQGAPLPLDWGGQRRTLGFA